MSKKNDGAGLNSRLIRRPIQRWAPLFILPVFAAFCIGFVWPFIQGNLPVLLQLQRSLRCQMGRRAKLFQNLDGRELLERV